MMFWPQDALQRIRSIRGDSNREYNFIAKKIK
jgi:hypothetical protein